MDDNDQQVQEAEVIPVPAKTEDNQAQALISLEEMIKKYITSLDKLRVETRKIKEMYDDSFLNNPTYIENQEKAKNAAKDLAVTKKNITSQPSVVQLGMKLKTMRDEMKETAASLSDYLLEYQRMTGANEIEGEDGKMRDIVNSAKLVVRSG